MAFKFVFIPLVAIGVFYLGALVTHKSERKKLISWCAFGLFLAKLGLNFNQVWEVDLFPWFGYLFVRPYILLVLFQFFLGTTIPQLDVRWNRIVIYFFAGLILFHFVVRTALMDEGLEHWYALAGTAGPDHHCQQTNPYTCGAASSVTLLSYHNVVTSEGDISWYWRPSMVGKHHYEYYKILWLLARDHGLRPRLLKVSFAELREMDGPVLLFGVHPTPIKAKDDKVLLHEPGLEKPRLITWEELETSGYFDGTVVVLVRDE